MTNLKSAASELAISYNRLQIWLGGKNRIDPVTLKGYEADVEQAWEEFDNMKEEVANYSDFISREQLENTVKGSVVL